MGGVKSNDLSNPPPMGACIVWWVGGLMGGVRSNQ